MELQIAILKSMNIFYREGISPSFNDVYESVKDIIPTELTSAQFENNMIVLGYIYKKMPFGRLLMEKPEITFQRFFYLQTIIETRKKNKPNIYYIDQRIIDNSLRFQKPPSQSVEALLQSTNDTSVFLYIVSTTTRQVNGIFTNVLDHANVNKWINDVVLDALKPKSVVVVDSNFGHTISRKELTMYDTKADILKWLKENSIPCTSNMRKAELFELYKKTPKKDLNCNFSSILEAHGHRVIYLPTTLEDLNPTNFLWNFIRNKLQSQDPDKPRLTNCGGVTNLICELSEMMMPTITSTFPGLYKIKQMEKELFKLDAEIEESLDNVLRMHMDNKQCLPIKTEILEID
ncbi:hypothetical protein O3G_MSEX001742 [Manduca sexta]|uniref:Uncharacterized protein n=1 Tax=Manduca sexta TaxID=7130 RepID=A0A922CCR1_MANSE|nr:hypothetical protein O3G_MSEX001742 [Manduca sexta]